MARQRKALTPAENPNPHVSVDNGWVSHESYQLGKKLLTRGMVVTVKGERGAKFRFLEHVVRPDGVEWLNFVGGSGHGKYAVRMFRSFRPDRVGRILKGVLATI